MDVATFLSHLGEVAASPLAFVAYALVLGAWLVYVYLRYRPQQAALEIIKTHQTESGRVIALGKLLGSDPPRGLEKNQILDWVKVKSKEKTRVLLLIAYALSVVGAIAIAAFAFFRSGDDPPPPAADLEMAIAPPLVQFKSALGPNVPGRELGALMVVVPLQTTNRPRDGLPGFVNSTTAEIEGTNFRFSWLHFVFLPSRVGMDYIDVKAPAQRFALSGGETRYEEILHRDDDATWAEFHEWITTEAREFEYFQINVSFSLTLQNGALGSPQSLFLRCRFAARNEYMRLIQQDSSIAAFQTECAEI